MKEIIEELARIRYGRYRFYLCFERDSILPPYKGSTLRGALKGSFYRVACTRREEPDCEHCLLRKACAHPRLFESFVEPGVPLCPGQSRPSLPLVLEVPVGEQRLYQEGEELSFGLILVGEANAFLPYLIAAVQEMGASGVGTGRRQGMGRFALRAVTTLTPDGEEILFSSHTPHQQGTGYLWQGLPSFDSEKASAPSLAVEKAPASSSEPKEAPALFSDSGESSASSLAAEEAPASSLEGVAAGFGAEGRARVEVELVTPLRFRQNNAFCRRLDFVGLVRLALRRLSSLAFDHCGGDLNFDFSALLEGAAEASLLRHDLTWHDWERYSGHQKRRMKMGGLVGHVAFGGVPLLYLPLLRLGALLHLGKNTSFGLGQIQLLHRLE